MQLSIITINLNNVDGLKKTIESVVSQTFTDYEYLVIDGGSTDGSVDVIKQYEDKITYWVSEPDKGIYNAMNKGILQAKGEYCLFLNSGDWLVNESVLQKFIICFQSHDDIVYGNIMKLFPDNMVRVSGVGKSNPTLYDLLSDFIPHQACFIRSSIFKTVGLYSEKYKIASDHKFFIEAIVFNRASTRYIDMDIAYFDVTGVSTKLVFDTHLENIAVHEEVIPPTILNNIKELRRYKTSRVIKLYDFAVENKALMKLYKLIKKS